MSSAKQGDIIEIGIEATNFGHTSITLTCNVRNMMTRESILNIDKIVFVGVDEEGKPTKHGKTQIEFVADRLQNQNEN